MLKPAQIRIFNPDPSESVIVFVPSVTVLLFQVRVIEARQSLDILAPSCQAAVSDPDSG